LDANAFISALLAPGGSPAAVLRGWIEGAYELVTSPLLLEELERALAYPKLRTRVRQEEAVAFVDLLRHGTQHLDDPEASETIRSPDPDDEYLIALAEGAQAVIVSGDAHLLGLAPSVPVYSPTQFLDLLEDSA
jgi:putative PIN family toxin of toxin-antitoxin system